MRFSLSIFGTEILAVSTEKQKDNKGPGDVTTYPLGFTASPGDQRWEKGVDL